MYFFFYRSAGIGFGNSWLWQFDAPAGSRALGRRTIKRQLLAASRSHNLKVNQTAGCKSALNHNTTKEQLRNIHLAALGQHELCVESDMGAAGRGSGVLQGCVFPLCQRSGSQTEGGEASVALMMLPREHSNSQQPSMIPGPASSSSGFHITSKPHSVICRQIISMTSDSNNTLLAVVLVWLDSPFRVLLVSGFQEGGRKKKKLATVCVGAQLVVLANDTGDQQ